MIMKKIFLLALFLGFNFLFPQEQTALKTEVQETNFINKVDKEAIYPGGGGAFRNNFSKIFNADNFDVKKTTKTEARFLIDENGYITKIIVTGDDKSLNKEMERSIKTMQKTKWVPATYNNQPVPYWFTLPMIMYAN